MDSKEGNEGNANDANGQRTSEERLRLETTSDCAEKGTASVSRCDSAGEKQCVLLISDGSGWSPPGVLCRGTHCCTEMDKLQATTASARQQELMIPLFFLSH